MQTVLWCGYAALPVLFPNVAVQSAAVLDASLLFALGLLMAVRINRAYERWWEGRTRWGTLVNASRNLAVKIHAFVGPEGEEGRRVHDLISGFAFGLRDHLRGGAKLERLRGFGADDGDPKYVPGFLVVQLYERFHAWTEADRMTQDELRMVDLEARMLLDVAGGCERIRNTALPVALTWVTRITIGVFLLLTPWLLLGELGWKMIPVFGVGAFLILGSEAIASALEHPFGTELNQLDLSVISAGIDESTAEILGVEA